MLQFECPVNREINVRSVEIATFLTKRTAGYQVSESYKRGFRHVMYCIEIGLDKKMKFGVRKNMSHSNLINKQAFLIINHLQPFT